MVAYVFSVYHRGVVYRVFSTVVESHHEFVTDRSFSFHHVTEIMALEEFEVRHDYYIPDFLKSLGKLADLYEKEDDFRATSLRRAIIALEGQIITAVEDIKLFNLGDLQGVA